MQPTDARTEARHALHVCTRLALLARDEANDAEANRDRLIALAVQAETYADDKNAAWETADRAQADASYALRQLTASPRIAPPAGSKPADLWQPCRFGSDRIERD